MNNRLQRLICVPKLESWISLDASGAAGGLLTSWNPNDFEGSLIQKGSHSLSITLRCNSSPFKFILSNIYGPLTVTVNAKNYLQNVAN